MTEHACIAEEDGGNMLNHGFFDRNKTPACVESNSDNPDKSVMMGILCRAEARAEMAHIASNRGVQRPAQT
jgi:hypothetical protein